jgi:hypothetical protein
VRLEPMRARRMVDTYMMLSTAAVLCPRRLSPLLLLCVSPSVQDAQSAIRVLALQRHGSHRLKVSAAVPVPCELSFSCHVEGQQRLTPQYNSKAPPCVHDGGNGGR